MRALVLLLETRRQPLELFGGLVDLLIGGLLLLPAALVFTGGLYALAPGRPLKAIALSLPLVWLGLMNMVGVALVP